MSAVPLVVSGKNDVVMNVHVINMKCLHLCIPIYTIV